MEGIPDCNQSMKPGVIEPIHNKQNETEKYRRPFEVHTSCSGQVQHAHHSIDNDPDQCVRVVDLPVCEEPKKKPKDHKEYAA